MNIRPVAILGALVLVVSTSKAPACSCACDGSLTVDDYVDRASLIVVGRVLEVRPGSPDVNEDSLTEQFKHLVGAESEDLTVISSCSHQTVRVAVEERLKGEAPAEVAFVQRAVGTPCDFGFQLRVGRSYLLFGLPGSDGQVLELPGCSPSAPAAKSKTLITRIRQRIGGAS